MGPEREKVAVRAPAEPNRSAGSRYALLDAWRGLACLMVVVHHAGYALTRAETGDDWGRWLAWLMVSRMSLGVSIFFVISGYCIAASADRTLARGEAPVSFLSRRVWRIYPPYWFAMVGFGALMIGLDAAGLSRFYQGPLAVVLDPPGALDWRQWLGNITLTETWRPHVWGPDRNVFTAVAWSLCFEEQFYLVCFLMLWLFPARLFTALAGATAAVGAVRLYAWHVGGLEGLSGSFPLLWHEFAVGLLVYYRLNTATADWQKRLSEAALAAMLAAGLLTGGRSTAAAAGFGLILVVIRRWDSIGDTAVWLAPFRACGRRCYSIYLAHLPAGVVGNQLLFDLGVTSFWARALVMVPLASLAGVVLGWAFHSAIESRFLGAPPRWTGRLMPGFPSRVASRFSAALTGPR